MKSFLILLLLINISCNKDAPTTNDTQMLRPINSETIIGTGGTTFDPTSVTKTEAFMKLINDHRMSVGVQPLVHEDELADISTTHSTNIATGVTPFGHDGFSERCAEGRASLGGGNLCGENVAMGQKTTGRIHRMDEFAGASVQY